MLVTGQILWVTLIYLSRAEERRIFGRDLDGVQVRVRAAAEAKAEVHGSLQPGSCQLQHGSMDDAGDALALFPSLRRVVPALWRVVKDRYAPDDMFTALPARLLPTFPGL